MLRLVRNAAISLVLVAIITIPGTAIAPDAAQSPTSGSQPASSGPSGSTSTAVPGATFADECNGSSLDPRWRPFFAAGDPGFGLDTDFLGNFGQVSVANGLCTITAEVAATPSGRRYASAILGTYGTFSQAYGTWEARIRYPAGQGVWPTFFLLPAGQKDGYPEIDVFEAYPAAPGAGGGSGVSTVVQTLHPTAALNPHTVVVTGVDMTADFHVHRMVWTPASLVFSIDGKVTSTVTDDVPSVPMYPIVDLALGAPGYRVDTTTPSVLTMDIDYVRVSAP